MKILATRWMSHFTHVVMVIATYRVATVPHDWHTIVRSRSSKVIDFNAIWKPVFDFLLVINSNRPVLHRLATIRRLQRTTDDDGRQPCKTPTALLLSDALWLEPALAQIPLRRLSPKLRRKESRGHKPSRRVEMFATKFVTSPRQTRLCRSNGI